MLLFWFRLLFICLASSAFCYVSSSLPLCLCSLLLCFLLLVRSFVGLFVRSFVLKNNGSGNTMQKQRQKHLFCKQNKSNIIAPKESRHIQTFAFSILKGSSLRWQLRLGNSWQQELPEAGSIPHLVVLETLSLYSYRLSSSRIIFVVHAVYCVSSVKARREQVRSITILHFLSAAFVFAAIRKSIRLCARSPCSLHSTRTWQRIHQRDHNQLQVGNH